MPQPVCSNPFYYHKKKVRHNLRVVSDSMVEGGLVEKDALVCDNCRKGLSRQVNVNTSSGSENSFLEQDSRLDENDVESAGESSAESVEEFNDAMAF